VTSSQESAVIKHSTGDSQGEGKKGAVRQAAAGGKSTTIHKSGNAGIVASLLEQGVSEGALPGGVVLASVAGSISAATAVGFKQPQKDEAQAGSLDPVDSSTVYDLGGLTQAVCTATVMMRLVSAGKIGVTDRASRFLQALGVGSKSSMTLAHLLSHTAGFPQGVSVYDELVRANAGPRPGILTSSGAKQYAYTHFHNLPLKFEPGARELHSDADYIVLGEICEIITGLPLEKAYSRYVAAPLKVSSLNFIDLTILRRRGLEPAVELFAASGKCARRGREIRGEVWDENAWVMGGVAGHSGLFGTASDVHAWACEVLRGYQGRSSLFTQDAVRAFVEPEVKLGFDVSSPELGFVEREKAPHAFVAFGSSGCSVFIDPQRDAVIVFLSNAGYSGHQSRRFPALRADIHAALLDL
jgi:CubicO group peptidase (beta-lactamase class C family)